MLISTPGLLAPWAGGLGGGAIGTAAPGSPTWVPSAKDVSMFTGMAASYLSGPVWLIWDHSSGLICLALEKIFLLTIQLALVFHVLVLNTDKVMDI